MLNSPTFLAGPPASQKIVVDSVPDWEDPQIFIGWIDFRDAIAGTLAQALANQMSVPDGGATMTRLGQLVLDKIPA